MSDFVPIETFSVVKNQMNVSNPISFKLFAHQKSDTYVFWVKLVAAAHGQMTNQPWEFIKS